MGMGRKKARCRQKTLQKVRLGTHRQGITMNFRVTELVSEGVEKVSAQPSSFSAPPNTIQLEGRIRYLEKILRK